MKLAESKFRFAWYVLTCLLAAFTYFYGLDSEHAPKNGDEYPYEHIVRLTAASGELLPLQSQMDNMRNTKPPLLFWQGIASTGWGADWSLWQLRYPSVIYTLLTAAMLLLLGRKLSGRIETGFIAALTWLAFLTTYRYGRPFLTNAPEVFWLFLPFFVLLYWRQTFLSRFVIPLLLGIGIGIGFLYKSFALGLPMTLGLTGWYLQQRDYRVAEFLKQDALKVTIAIAVAVGMFALWFAVDPDPQAVWQEFVVGENVGKFDPHGPSYLSKLLWSGSSIWSYTAAFLTNPGLLTFPVVAMFVLVYKRRSQLGSDEKLLLILIAAFFISFALPSQRSGRYLLAAMPAVALLCALNWQFINRKVFVATLVLSGMVVAGLAYLAMRLQTELADAQLYPPLFWLLLAFTALLLLAALFMPGLTRPAVNVVALLVLLSFAAFLRPFDGPPGNFSADAQQYAAGKRVWVPCNFRAKDEGHRFVLPGADVHGYAEFQNFTVADLSARYPLFAVRLPLRDEPQACDGCKIIGQRLTIRDRQSSAEVKAMFREGKVLQTLFAREVLMESPRAANAIVAQSMAEACR
ncbi:MAG: phospholipid carrier-dependent glycosyltransferase [Nitrosomonadales bacterium]|nr:phospholipid carrier-dependent glycosyltransferase [Nitrosomonadales bacterium]